MGSLAGALLAIGHPDRGRRLIMCAVAPDMVGPTRTYLAERAKKVWLVGMRGVAEASLANSFPASHPAERAAYRGIYLGNDPTAYAELSLALGRLEMTPADWGSIRAPVLVASGADDFLWPPSLGQQVAALVPGARFAVIGHRSLPASAGAADLGWVGARVSWGMNARPFVLRTSPHRKRPQPLRRSPIPAPPGRPDHRAARPSGPPPAECEDCETTGKTSSSCPWR